MKQVLLVLVAVAACADEPDTTVVNRGHACAYAWPPRWDVDAELSNDPQLAAQPPAGYDTRAFVAGTPALLWVRTTASPCATELRATCAVELHGNELVVRSSASWNEPEGCAVREAAPSVYSRCKSPALEAGTYSVRLGSAQGAFAMPDDPSLNPCFDAP